MRIDIGIADDGVQPRVLKHSDILCLLRLVGNIVHRLGLYALSRVLLADLFAEKIVQRFVFAPEIFENDNILYFIVKFVVFQSATFLVICLEIFCTCLSFCRKLLETLSGMSGQSITPLRSIRNSGMTSLMLSAMNT